MNLASFFAAMQPMLLGREPARDVEARIGASPSGTGALAFYAVLVSRNVHKILRECCPALFTLASRAGAWHRLVRDYLDAHPPSGGDPNRFADDLPEFLQASADLPPAWAELADYDVLRVRAYHAADGEDDGFDRRLFVRLYSHPIPAIVQQLGSGGGAVLPAPRPTPVIVFRHARTHRVGSLVPDAPRLAALAHRQRLDLPAVLGRLPDAAVTAAERSLVRDGVLLPSRPRIVEDPT